MDRNHFINQMERLVQLFPQAYKSRDRMEMIWREACGTENDGFSRIVDHLVGGSRQPPLVEEFRNAAAIERELAWSSRKREPQQDAWNENPKCEWCRDRGTFVCVKPPLHGVFAFRCHCEHGLADPRSSIPQYKQDHARDGYVFLSFEELKAMRANAVQAEAMEAQP